MGRRLGAGAWACRSQHRRAKRAGRSVGWDRPRGRMRVRSSPVAESLRGSDGAVQVRIGVFPNSWVRPRWGLGEIRIDEA